MPLPVTSDMCVVVTGFRDTVDASQADQDKTETGSADDLGDFHVRHDVVVVRHIF